MRDSGNADGSLSEHSPSNAGIAPKRASAVEWLARMQHVLQPEYLPSFFGGGLLVLVGIVLLAHGLGSASTPPASFFVIALTLIVFNVVCPIAESRLKKAVGCPFFPSIIVNLLLISALMYAVAGSSPRLGLNLSFAYLFLSLAASISLKPRQNIMLSALILFLLASFLLKTEGILPALSYLIFFSLLLTALTLTPLLNPSRSSRESLKSNIKASNLTKRERELVLLLAEGKANQEIASSLGISEKTVRNTLTSVYRKLNVGSRQEAILRFV